MKVIALSNQKGGVGKTTTAVNLSSAIAISGKKVLLIDLDSQGNASTSLSLGVNMRRISIYDAIIGNVDVNSAIITTSIPNLDAIPSVMALAGVENILFGEKNKELILRSMIKKIRAHYDYIFIDCSPSLGLLSINALAAANSIMVALQCEFLAMEGVAYLLGTLKLIKSTINRDLHIEGIVLTMYDKRNKLCNQVIDEVRKEFGELVYETVIPRNIKLSESPSHGMPAIIYDPKCLGSISYMILANEFMAKSKSPNVNMYAR